VYTTDALDSKSRVEVSSNPVHIGNIEVFYFKNFSNYLCYKYRLPLPLGMPLEIKDKIKKFDVIHLHGYPHSQNIIVHHYAQKHHVAYVLQAHGSLTPIATNSALRKVYELFWGRRILKDASRLLAGTAAEAQQYRGMGVSEDKIEIIPHGIDALTFEDLPKRGEFRAKYGLKDNQKVILYLGRIHWLKGLDLLLKAFADISNDFDDVKLVIAGPDHGFLPTLKKLVKELEIEGGFLFAGPLYGREKLEAYVDADVYVLPAIYESFSLTVLESCACGLPVVVTDRCGVADIIDGQAGLVVPYDRNQLGDAILRILSDDKIRQQFAEKGKLLVRERFAWEKLIEQIEKVYQSISSHEYRCCP